MDRRRLSTSLLLLLTAGAQAQSLGDIARQQQQKKSQHPTTVSNKVLTNDDLGAGAPSNSDQASSVNQKEAAKPKLARDEQSANSTPKISAEEFKQKIQRQKDAIAAIQGRIDDLQGTINYVQNNRNIYTNAPEYNEAQKRKQQQIDQLKGVLQERKNELKDLQEQARQAGYGSAVYD